MGYSSDHYIHYCRRASGLFSVNPPHPPHPISLQLVSYVAHILLSLQHVHFNVCIMERCLSVRFWTADHAMSLSSCQYASLAMWHTMGLTASEFHIPEAYFLSRTSHCLTINSALCVGNIVIRSETVWYSLIQGSLKLPLNSRTGVRLRICQWLGMRLRITPLVKCAA